MSGEVWKGLRSCLTSSGSSSRNSSFPSGIAGEVVDGYMSYYPSLFTLPLPCLVSGDYSSRHEQKRGNETWRVRIKLHFVNPHLSHCCSRHWNWVSIALWG